MAKDNEETADQRNRNWILHFLLLFHIVVILLGVLLRNKNNATSDDGLQEKFDSVATTVLDATGLFVVFVNYTTRRPSQGHD